MDHEKCPCDSVVQIRKDFEKYKLSTDAKLDVLSNGQQTLEVNIAMINTKLNFIIGGISVLSVALAGIIVPMMFGR